MTKSAAKGLHHERLRRIIKVCWPKFDIRLLFYYLNFIKQTSFNKNDMPAFHLLKGLSEGASAANADFIQNCVPIMSFLAALQLVPEVREMSKRTTDA